MSEEAEGREKETQDTAAGGEGERAEGQTQQGRSSSKEAPKRRKSVGFRATHVYSPDLDRQEAALRVLLAHKPSHP